MLVKTPPMGWNTWNTFGKDINEQLLMETADIIVEKGYKDAGYEYIVIDDCWALKERDAEGHMVPDPEKFPHGMKYLSDYIHSKGLKFGMYSCAGVMTCAGYPGSYGHEFLDAKDFADWGVDYLKYDFCHFPKNADCKTSYLTMSMALRSSGRDILFSACNWGWHEPEKWMRSIGAHMYRSQGDIWDNFKSIRDIIVSQEDMFYASAPCCFNDMDMMVVGMNAKGNVADNEFEKAGCTDEEYKMHFALWCMFGTPLMIGADVRKIPDDMREILLNKELIKINQDPEARPPYRLRSTVNNTYYDDTTETADNRTYIKILSDNTIIIGLFNFIGNIERRHRNVISAYFTEMGFVRIFFRR